MPLGVPEIRERAERLKSAIALERYQIKAGLKVRSEFAALYASHALLTGADVMPAIQAELAEATGEERRRLRALLAWIADQRVEAAVAALEDEYRGWEGTARLGMNGEELQLREIPGAIAREPDRDRRLRLEGMRNATLEAAISLQVDTLHREREAVTGLGLGGFLEARERLSGLNIHGLERHAVQILGATEDTYREHLSYQARKRLEVDPAELTRSDARWLHRMAWLDGHFQLERVLGTVGGDLGQLGLPILGDGKVQLDVEPRPLKSRRSFSAAIRVPDHVILVISPSGGWPDSLAMMHEIGHAVHFAYTGAQLPFEYRALGDASVTETYAVLFESLVLERSWVERTVGLSGGELEDYRRLAGLLALYRLRRIAARLLYQVELYQAELPGESGGRYVELLTGTTGFRFDPRTYLRDLDRGFWVARQLRAWMLRSILYEQLRDRYDEDWYQNPGAGPFLGELLSAGQRDDAGRLAVQLGVERLDPEALLRSTDEWLR